MEISGVDVVTGYLESVERVDDGVLCRYEDGTTMFMKEEEIKKIYKKVLLNE